MREEIDDLRKEKVIFDGVYAKLEKELNAKRKNIAHIIEAANMAYEERDQVQDRLANIKFKNDKE